jgi:hypothetical protein
MRSVHAALAILVGVLIAVNTAWVARFRLGYPLNIDEAGYLATAVADTLAWSSSGLLGLWRAFQAQEVHAPLVMLVTAPVQRVLPDDVLAGFLVIELFFALLVVATWALAARLANPRAGLLAAFVVATAPGITDYVRQYQFAVPSAALFTAAIFAQLRSEGLRSRGWAVAWGALLGLTALTRTMTLALLPGLVVVAAWQVWTRRGDGSGQGLHLAIGLLTAAATALVWYGRNWAGVLAYLLDSGYGARSEITGPARGLDTADFWLARLVVTIQQGMHLPLAVLVLICLALGLVAWTHRARPQGVRAALGRAFRSDAGQVLLVLAWAYLALTSTRNVGTGFVLTLVPPAVALAVASLVNVSRRGLRRPLTAGFLLVGALNVAATANVSEELSTPRGARLPVLGRLPVLDGRWAFREYLLNAGHDAGALTEPPPAVHREWLGLERRVVSFTADFATAHGKRPSVLFASKDPLFNANALRLAGHLHLGRPFLVGQLKSAPADRLDVYRTQLDDARSGANFLITTPPGPWEFQPAVTQALAEAAARQLGFEPVRVFRLPDGRTTRIWWNPRGADLPADERVRAGFLKATTLELEPGGIEPGDAGPVRIAGTLADSSGTPLRGARVELGVHLDRGLGAWGVYRRSGRVPAGASHAVVGVRVNTECECVGSGEIAFRRVRYQETAAPRGAESGVEVRLAPRDFPGAPVVADAPGPPPGAAVLLRVPRTGTALLNSTAFPVRPGSRYDLHLTASVSAASVGSGYFALVFLDGAEVLRETIPFQPTPLAKPTVTTSEDGRFEATLRDLPHVPLRVTAVYRGDASYWPARAVRVVER